MARSLQATIGFLLLAMSAGAATTAIGTVSAPGAFRIDNYQMQNSGTVFAGSKIETAQAPVQVMLKQNVQIRMAADSSGNIFTDRMVLVAGESEIAAHGVYSVDAAGLTVTPGEAESHGRVAVHGDRTVQVSAFPASWW